MSEMGTILGKKTVKVEKLDGTTEDVEVAQVHLDGYQRYLELLDDEIGQVEWLCRKPAGWARGLTIESVERILETGQELNGGFFGRWLQRRLQRVALVTGGAGAQVSGLTSGLQKPVSPQE